MQLHLIRSKLFVVMKGPTLPRGSCSRLQLTGTNFLLHFCEHVHQISSLPRWILTLDNWPLLEEILIFSLLNWNITQGQAFKRNSSPSEACKDLIQAPCFSSAP